MKVRRAENKDIEKILDLLIQVDMVHHNGRPDIFKGPVTKYNAEQLEGLITEDERPIFVCVDDNDLVLGHAFCIHQQIQYHKLLTDIKTLYIDDICVDEDARGKGVGKMLYEFVKEYAKEKGFYNITLNVWECNPTAIRFYESMGLKPQRIGMETIL